MGLGRRSFLTRAAVAVGTVGAAASAEAWPKEAVASLKQRQRSDDVNPYPEYHQDLQRLTQEVEAAQETVEGWKWPEFQERPNFISKTKEEQAEYDAYAQKHDAAQERLRKTIGWVGDLPLMAPIWVGAIADSMGMLEEAEAKPVIIVSSPRDFSDFRKMDNPEVKLVYDEGPIRARAYTVPVVTSTKIGSGNLWGGGLTAEGDLKLVLWSVAR